GQRHTLRFTKKKVNPWYAERVQGTVEEILDEIEDTMDQILDPKLKVCKLKKVLIYGDSFMNKATTIQLLNRCHPDKVPIYKLNSGDARFQEAMAEGIAQPTSILLFENIDSFSNEEIFQFKEIILNKAVQPNPK